MSTQTVRMQKIAGSEPRPVSLWPFSHLALHRKLTSTTTSP